jgi:integrase
MEFVQPIRDPELLEDLKKHLKQQNERDYVLFMLGINTGFRISDILTLKVKDVRGERINIREKKTGKAKNVVIRPSLKKIIKVYIAGKKPHEYLFKSRKGKNKPITREYAYQLLKKAAIEVGIGEFGTHTMRKTFGYMFYNQTKDIVALRKLFNHRDDSTTLRYIGLDQDRLDDLMLKIKI